MPQPLMIFLVLLIPLAGCTPTSSENAPTATVNDWLTLKVGNVELEAQIALQREEQRRGLMYRDSLPENHGMLFPYVRPSQMSFWMANTKIPLDIGFFDGTGLLLEVHRMVPFDTNKTPSNSNEVQYALEMNAGWFSLNEVYPGQRLDMTLLTDALRARGVDPSRFGLSE